ncbi:LysE family transporter [Burkholderia sp. BKH01]|uniref:LysE family translocator n=1 Tax=Burkholderia sp. BKH01 TaxID=2769262 RepID=UPI0021DFA7DB|nr:LysE family transporter [Burkholderia sp. BKH01]MCU9953804.1 LysE family transporter [Burkholderia sp. BKH01]
MSIQTWILFAAAYLATTLSPGPNVLLVIRNTVRYGSHGTAATIAGNLVAQGVVVLLVALGVGAVLAAMPPLFVSGSNPKTMIFLSAFMPQFVVHDRPLALQFVVMYATIACTVVVVHSVYSAGVRRFHRGFGMSRAVRTLKRASGLLFVGLGIKLLTARQA